MDGLDLCFVATGDLSNSMGYPGRPEHPEVIKVRNQAIEKIAESDKIAGTVTTEKDVDEMIRMGARLVTTGYQSWVEEGAAKYLREIKNSIIIICYGYGYREQNGYCNCQSRRFRDYP